MGSNCPLTSRTFAFGLSTLVWKRAGFYKSASCLRPKISSADQVLSLVTHRHQGEPPTPASSMSSHVTFHPGLSLCKSLQLTCSHSNDVNRDGGSFPRGSRAHGVHELCSQMSHEHQRPGTKAPLLSPKMPENPTGPNRP